MNYCVANLYHKQIFYYFEMLCFISFHILYQENSYVYTSRCSFSGTNEGLVDHLPGCPYEALKAFIETTDSRINKLQCVIQQKDEEIGFLRSMLSKLAEKVDTLEKNYDIKLGGYILLLIAC